MKWIDDKERFETIYDSNCLFEALKAKIRNFRGVRLRYVPARYNEVFVPHIMWEDGKHTYDFYTNRKLNFFQIFWHKGYIRINEIDYYERAIDSMRQYKERRAKKRGSK